LVGGFGGWAGTAQITGVVSGLIATKPAKLFSIRRRYRHDILRTKAMLLEKKRPVVMSDAQDLQASLCGRRSTIV
jgi:hypothetical protein